MPRSRQSRRLEERIAAIPLAVREAVQPALIRSVEEIADTMRRFAPEDEGDLKDSITVTGPGKTTPSYSQPGGSRVAADTEALVTAGNSDVRYPHLQEYGTTFHDAQPFFWPAVRLLRKRIERRMKRTIAKAVRDSWKRP